MITPVPAEFISQQLGELHEKGADHLRALLDDLERKQPVMYAYFNQALHADLSPQEHANLVSVGLNM